MKEFAARSIRGSDLFPLMDSFSSSNKAAGLAIIFERSSSNAGQSFTNREFLQNAWL